MDMQRSYYYSPHLHIVLKFSWIKDLLKGFGQRSPSVGSERIWKCLELGGLGQLVEERGYQASLGWTQSCLAELTAKAKRHLKADMPFPCKCREDQVPEKRKTAQEAQLSEWVSWSCCNQRPQPGQLKQHRHILSHFWRLEVQNHGVSRAVLSLEVLGENPSCLF